METLAIRANKIFLFLLLFAKPIQAQTLPWQDQDFLCTDQKIADRYIRELNIDVRSFGGFELCNSKIDTKKLFNDLEIIEKGIYQAQGNNKLIKGFVPADRYYSWLKSQTRGMSRGNDIPYAIAYNSGGHFVMQDGWASLSTLGRIGTLVHEARHTAGFGHLRCRQGPYANTSVPGCDSHYDQGGSHAVEMEYYARVHLYGTNFHPVYKSMARLMAMARANFVFNQPVLSAREALLTMEPSGAIWLYDRGEWFLRQSPRASGKLKRTSFGASLLDGELAWALDPYAVTGDPSPIEDAYSYFKLLGRETKGAVLDLEEFDSGQLRLLIKITTKGDVAQYNFARGGWHTAKAIGFIPQSTSTITPTGRRGYFAVSPAAEIFAYDPAAQNFVRTPELWPEDLAAAVNLGGQILFLSRTDGLIYTPTAKGTLEPWPNLKSGLKLQQMVAVPLYDAFEIVR
ncbi:MAG: hypothetical protein N2578_03300 [Bdellovibrionaceae bacterium]|nr:hypothetical protein [Pseudobdellovibrionaceae bacterium]